MRISSQASEQYRKTSDLAEMQSERASVQPHAKTTVTSFGFQLGKFGLDYKGETTVLDPSLSRDVREKKQKARNFRAEAEVKNLRAEVGAMGADSRDAETEQAATPSPTLIRTALGAYSRATARITPPPGNMLVGVV